MVPEDESVEKQESLTIEISEFPGSVCSEKYLSSTKWAHMQTSRCTFLPVVPETASFKFHSAIRDCNQIIPHPCRC